MSCDIYTIGFLIIYNVISHSCIFALQRISLYFTVVNIPKTS